MLLFVVVCVFICLFRKLQQCLDVYYEIVVKGARGSNLPTPIKSSSSSSKSGAGGTGGSGGNDDFGKFCMRPFRGRARALPFVFNTDIGLFDQK